MLDMSLGQAFIEIETKNDGFTKGMRDVSAAFTGLEKRTESLIAGLGRVRLGAEALRLSPSFLGELDSISKSVSSFSERFSASQIDVVFPKIEIPPVVLPPVDVKVPEIDVMVPPVKVPDIEVPPVDVKVPDIEVPDIKVPELDLKVPPIKVPDLDIKLPKVDVDVPVKDHVKLERMITTVIDADLSGFESVVTEMGMSLSGLSESFEMSSSELSSDFGDVGSVLSDAKYDLRGVFDDLVSVFDRVGGELSEGFSSILNVLASVDSDFANAASSVQTTVGAAAQGDAVGFFSSLPDLQRDLQSLIAPFDGQNIDAQLQNALNIRGRILKSDELSESQKRDLVTPIENLIREIVVRSVDSAGAFAPALEKKFDSLLGAQGFDFDLDRARGILEDLDIDLNAPDFDNLLEVSLAPTLNELQRLQREFSRPPKIRRPEGVEPLSNLDSERPENVTKIRREFPMSLEMPERPETAPTIPTTGTDLAEFSRSHGFSLRSITGETRDVLLQALSPLKSLDTTFPAMLDVMKEAVDELRNIKIALVPGLRIPSQSATPTAPVITSSLSGRDLQQNANFTSNNAPARGGIQITNLNLTIEVEQIQDIDINEIRREIEEAVDFERRGDGDVFPGQGRER